MGDPGLKILILSFYFRPDLCAGSFRTTALVDALCKVAAPDLHIDVMTTLPNRYHSFTVDAPFMENQPGLSIFRITLPKHQSGFLDQSKAFFFFSLSVTRLVADKEYDIVFATSSRLMTAVLGAWISRRKDAKLYLDIRDIFVDIIKEVLPRSISWLVWPFFSVLEKWTIKQADKVNLVSLGFWQYFNLRYPKKHFSYYTNGIDDEFLAFVPTQISMPDKRGENKTITVLYAGNLGEGQGLHNIIPELAKRMESRIHIKIIGDGGCKRILEIALTEIGVTNVELLPPIKRDELIVAYRAADVLFLHLNDYDAFKKVLPSKLFEYTALGKPVWAGVSGYAAEFVKSEISNAAVFHPCDVEEAVHSFDELVLLDAPRTTFIMKYARANISKKMAKDIVALVSDKC